MGVTEPEAKKTWCAFAHVAMGAGGAVLNGQPGFNRIQDGPDGPIIPPSTACLASRCRHWRWDRVRVPPDDPQARELGPHATRESTTHGDCGLSGPS